MTWLNTNLSATTFRHNMPLRTKALETIPFPLMELDYLQKLTVVKANSISDYRLRQQADNENALNVVKNKIIVLRDANNKDIWLSPRRPKFDFRHGNQTPP